MTNKGFASTFALCSLVLWLTSVATARPFPGNLPDREWVGFSADGFNRPVTGIIYRCGNMLPGMPLGALGTGFISLGTDGTLDYTSTIFNTFMDRTYGIIQQRDKVSSFRLPFLGLAIDRKAMVLALNQVAGVGMAADIDYWGHYPVADMIYDTGSPVAVSLRAWTPFFPGDAAGSNTPGFVFEVRLTNTGNTKKAGTLVFTFSGCRDAGDVPTYARNIVGIQRRVVRGLFNGVVVSGKRDGLARSYVLGAIGEDVVRLGGELGKDAKSWNSIGSSLPVPSSNEIGSSVAVRFALKPGKSRIVRFILAWYAPAWKSSTLDWWPTYRLARPDLPKAGNIYINNYTTGFTDAADVAEFLAREHGPLLRRVISWQDTIYREKRLPGWLQDSLINVLAVLAQDSFWVKSTNPSHWWGNRGFFCVNESLLTCPQQACIANDEFGEWVINLLFPELGLRKLEAFRHYQEDTGQTPSTLGAGTEPDRPWYDQQVLVL